MARAPAVKIILAGGAGLLAYFLGRSLRWPLPGDAAVFHYTAWLIAQGAAPYRDVFDMNFPGIYLVHRAVLGTVGTGDAAWRVFDLGWLGATTALMYRYCRPMGDRRSAAAAALLLAVYHVAGGASLAGQRDFLLCVFLLAGAYGVARFRETSGRSAPLIWAGLALGAGMMLKPHAGLFWLATAAAAAVAARRLGQSPVPALIAVLGAGCIVPTLVVGWLAWTGGLDSFVSIFIGWTLPLYSQLRGALPVRVLISPGWALLAALALLGAAAPVPEPFGVRRGLALVGAGYGFLHFALQFKSWDYYLYPLAFFLCVVASPALAVPMREAGSGPLRRWHSRAALAPAVLAAALVVMGVRGERRLDQPYDVQRERRADAIGRDLRRLVGPRETVQGMGFAAAPALLRLGLRQPTRFLGDFVFFLDSEDPRTRALRAEFVAGLEAGRPAAIVVLPERGAGSPFARLDTFPALTRLLEQRYTVAVEGWGYRIYGRRPGP